MVRVGKPLGVIAASFNWGWNSSKNR